jgi:hypothetical protein
MENVDGGNGLSVDLTRVVKSTDASWGLIDQISITGLKICIIGAG